MGDLLRNTKMTELFSLELARKQEHSSDANGAHDAHGNDNFVNYYTEDVYEDISADPGMQIGKGANFGNAVSEDNKNYIDVLPLFMNSAGTGFLDSLDYFKAPSGLADTTNILNHVAFLRNSTTEPTATNEFNSFWLQIFGKFCLKGILKKYKENFRTYKDIMEGKPAYAEDVFYSIKKYEKILNDPTAEYQHIQTIIVPNTSDLNIFNYVDTQVKYGDNVAYKYEVYVHKMVFGAKYEYFWPSNETDIVPQVLPLDSDLADGDLSVSVEPSYKRHTATFGVTVYPDIRLIEDLYFKTPEIKILDRPPVAPDVNIVPYRAVNNRVLILLNAMVDNYLQNPIYINIPEDISKFDEIKKSQLVSSEIISGEISLTGKSKKVHFSSDDPVSLFEIYRTTTRPSSYVEFSGEDAVKEVTALGTYVDKILPNTKYYYTFRAIDKHGHVSNPTSIYEVELVDDRGAVKPIIRTIELDKDELQMPIKEARKYIFIKPTLKQLFASPGTTDEDLDHAFISPPENNDSIGKKRYKIRLTSKSTGKMADVNIAFIKKEK